MPKKIVCCSICGDILKTKNYKPKSGIILCKHHASIAENMKRKMSDENKKKMSKKLKEVFSNPELRQKLSLLHKERLKDKTKHPMFGKHHSKETIEKIKHTQTGRNLKLYFGEEKYNEITKKQSIALSGENNPSFGKIYYPKKEFVMELNHIVRSDWEKRVCIKLKQNNISYEYEPECFELIIDNDKYTYTPDIKIKNVYLEIKGPLYDLQLNKMKELNKIKNLIIITSKKNFNRLSGLKCIDYEEFIKENFDVIKFVENLK